MTPQELEQSVTTLYRKFQNVPGVDRDFIHKCLSGVASLGDREVEAKLLRLISFL